MSVQPGALKSVHDPSTALRPNGASGSSWWTIHPDRFRKGIASCLSKYPNLEIVGEASGGQEAIRKARELAPDVIMMDMEMPEMDGLSVTQTLRKEMPQTKILISFHAPKYRDVVLHASCNRARSDHVVKDAPVEELW